LRAGKAEIRSAIFLSMQASLASISLKRKPVHTVTLWLGEESSLKEWENGVVTSVRMDKWLWAARFFRTRALAARACDLGRIRSNKQMAKASRDVRPGDFLQITNDSGDFEVEVLLLSEVRGPAAIAQTLYRETEASKELRQKVAEERKALPYSHDSEAGKPSKRDRRKITQFRGRQ
jgi:ribosome-associated heat shock protein Hsp15